MQRRDLVELVAAFLAAAAIGVLVGTILRARITWHSHQPFAPPTTSYDQAVWDWSGCWPMDAGYRDWTCAV